MYKPGDTIQLNFCRIPTTFQFLGENDVIDENTYYQSPYTRITQACPDNYAETVARFDKADSIFPSNCVGDRPRDGHKHRIYLRKLGTVAVEVPKKSFFAALFSKD